MFQRGRYTTNQYNWNGCSWIFVDIDVFMDDAFPKGQALLFYIPKVPGLVNVYITIENHHAING
jgi:hypothetical protein